MKAKVIIATATAATLVTVSANQAYAGQKEWATAGKILTGVVAATVIHQAMQPQVVHSRVVHVNHAPPRHSGRVMQTRTTYRHPPTYGGTHYRRTTTTRRVTTYHRPVAVPVCSGPVIMQIDTYTRLYQPRVRGHNAWVQNWCPHTRTWVSVQHHRSIW